MAVRKASAVWNGNLTEGNGRTKGGSGAFDVPYSFSTRFQDEPGTNPEELIGAAYAGCYAMALSAGLANDGYTVNSVSAEASVHFTKDDTGFAIRKIVLDVVADVDSIEEAIFQTAAETTKTGCPISKALAAVELVVNASLK